MTDIRAFFEDHPCEAWHSHAIMGTPAWSKDVTRWRYTVQPHILRFADFPVWRGARVLDIGCGLGTDSLQFAKAGATVVGIDISPRTIELAKTRNEPLRGITADFLVMDAEEDLPSLVEGKYHLVWAFGSLHHMKRPELALSLIRKRLSATGTLKLMVYARWSLKFLLGKQPEAYPGCPTVRTYTSVGIRSLLEKNGFGVNEIRKAHIFPYDIERYRKGEFHVKWPYSWMTEDMLTSFGEKMGHHLLVTARPI